MAYESRKKKISTFAVDDALTDASTLDFIKNGINKKTSWENIRNKLAEVFGLSARIFATEADLIASDIAIGEYAIVEENNTALYKITSLAANSYDVTLTSGFTASLEGPLLLEPVADYTALRAINTKGIKTGQTLSVTNSGIGGPGVLRNVVGHGLTDNGINIIVINSDWYWDRSVSGIGDMSWAQLSGGATDDTAKFQSAIDSDIDMWAVPYDPSGYTINTLTNSGTTFLFVNNSAMNGTSDLKDVGFSVSEQFINGVPTSDDIKDGKVEFFCGTIRAQQNRAVSSIVRSGSTATVTLVGHGYVTGDWVVHSGWDQAGFNGTFEVGSYTDDTYNILVDSGTATPGTGSGVTRCPGWWDWISDSTHQVVGFDNSAPVRSSGSGFGLTVNFKKSYAKVLSFETGPDETISAGQNISLGPSVAVGALEIRASVDKTVAGTLFYDGADWQKSMGSSQGDVYTAEAPAQLDDLGYTSGNLTFSHSFCPGKDIRLTPSSVGGTVTPFIPVLKSNDNNTVTVNFLTVSAGALTLYTGAASTSMAFQFTKNYNSIISFDGSDRSGEIGLQFGNIWMQGFMLV